MVINLNHELINLNGDPIFEKSLDIVINQVLDKYTKNNFNDLTAFIKEVNAAKGDHLTVRKALINCILWKNPEEEIDADESLRRWIIATGLKATDHYELSEKDRDIVKKSLIKLYGIEVIGQIMVLLRGSKENSKILKTIKKAK